MSISLCGYVFMASSTSLTPFPSLLFPLSLLLQISAVGELSRGSSSIIFHILNGTDTSSDPIPVPALLIAMAIEASNVQEVDSYPVSMSGEEKSGMISAIL